MERGGALTCVLSLLAASGCGLVIDYGPPEDGGTATGLDASRRDGSMVLDSSMGDASGMLDGQALLDASMRVDAGTCSPSVSEIACAPLQATAQTSGIGLSSMFWPGFRFEVPPGCNATLTRVGLTADSSTNVTHTHFAAIVALTGPIDYPDDPTLQGADVLGMTTMSLPGTVESTTSGALSLILEPGWYAAVFGAGAFDATLADALVASRDESGQCTNLTNPFTIRTSDGNYAGQSASPHMFVVFAP